MLGSGLPVPGASCVLTFGGGVVHIGTVKGYVGLFRDIGILEKEMEATI